MSEKTVILVTPAFLKRQLEISFTNTFGSITRTLRTYPVVARFHDSVEDCIAAGDLETLQVMFSGGAVSPLAVDEDGETLLHVRMTADIMVFLVDSLQLAAGYSRPEICIFLIQLGVDPDRTSTDGR
jgi:hypothetical protein